jgi:hypothetical protein
MTAVAVPHLPGRTDAIQMDFSAALLQLKAGARIARSGWNGAGMWLAYSPGHLNCPADALWSAQNRTLAEALGGSVRVDPYITMKTAQDSIVPWLASQTDLLASDWTVVP